MSKREFDWSQAAFDLFNCSSDNIREMVSAAQLDPTAGDLCGADFLGLDLSGYDLSGWDLRNVSFVGANLARTDFRSTKFDYFSILEAKNWDKAIFEEDEKHSIEQVSKMKVGIGTLPKIEAKIANRLSPEKIELIGDLVQMKSK